MPTRQHHKHTKKQDPCNFPEQQRKHFSHDTLWPSQQARARQESCKPPSSNIALGDGRIDPFVTSYSRGALCLFWGG